MATVLKQISPAKAKKPESGTVHWLNDCIERGKHEVFSETVTVSPGLAGELLRRNDGNRGIKPAKAEQYAADMRADRWTFNGEPIIISDSGEVNDGQHRMQAVIDANRPTPFLFVFGVPRASRETVDQGAARTAGDYLGMGDMPNATVVATIARLLLAYEASQGQNVDTRLITNAQVVARARADDAIAVSAHFAVTTGRAAKQYVAATIIGFCHYLFSDIDANDATVFLHQVCTAEDCSARCPALAVRERMLNEGKARQPKVALLFRGWNLHRRDMKIKPQNLTAKLPLPALI